MFFETANILSKTIAFLSHLHLAEADKGPVVKKLTTSLVNDSLKFQTLIPQICQYFLLKKCEKLFSFFQQKISVFLVIKL